MVGRLRKSKASRTSMSCQDLAERAKFRLVALGGGARRRECAPDNRPGERGERDPRRGRRESEGVDPRREAEGSRSEAEMMEETLRFPVLPKAFTKHFTQFYISVQVHPMQAQRRKQNLATFILRSDECEHLSYIIENIIKECVLCSHVGCSSIRSGATSQ